MIIIEDDQEPLTITTTLSPILSQELAKTRENNKICVSPRWNVGIDQQQKNVQLFSQQGMDETVVRSTLRIFYRTV